MKIPDPYREQRGPLNVVAGGYLVDFTAKRDSYDGTPDSHKTDRLLGVGDSVIEAIFDLYDREAEYFDPDPEFKQNPSFELYEYLNTEEGAKVYGAKLLYEFIYAWKKYTRKAAEYSTPARILTMGGTKFHGYAFSKVDLDRIPNRYEEGGPAEQVLGTSSRFSYSYAVDILQGPFSLGEEAISKDTSASGPTRNLGYAFVRGPFPLGEANISRESRASYVYATKILKGPFPLGEVAIASLGSGVVVRNLVNYAINFKKDRFKIAEPKIFLYHSDSAQEYIDFCVGLGYTEVEMNTAIALATLLNNGEFANFIKVNKNR